MAMMALLRFLAGRHFHSRSLAFLLLFARLISAQADLLSLFNKVTPDSQDEIIENFLQWMADNGVPPSAKSKVVVEPPSPHQFGTARRRDVTLVAARDIRAGEILFSVPPALQVASDKHGAEVAPLDFAEFASRSPHLAHWLEHLALSCWLLRQLAAGEASPWYPYLLTLPPDITSPVFFPDHIVELFESPDVIQSVPNVREGLAELYSKVNPEALAGASLEDFLWATLLVSSRSFENADAAPNSVGQLPYIFLPYADFMNHAADSNVDMMMGDESEALFAAKRDIPQGQELLYDYGLKDTSTFLLHYGFVPDKNPGDVTATASSKEDLAAQFYSALNMQARSEDEQRRIMEQMVAVVQQAVAAVQTVKAEWVQWRNVTMKTSQYDMSEDQPFRFWADGGVDPRAMASFAALSYRFQGKQEPNYRKLAQAAAWYGWRAMNGTCKSAAEIYQLSEGEYGSLVFAARLCLAVASGMAGVYSNTIPEDAEFLQVVRKCRAYALQHGDLHQHRECPDSISEYGYAIEMAVKYKIVKKRLIENVVERLTDECVAEYAQQVTKRKVKSEASKDDEL